METPTARFLSSAKRCRIRDLEQLIILGELVKSISELIHALQRERGASSIFLGSNGAQFTERLTAQLVESNDLEQGVRQRFERIDKELDRMSSGARFYTRAALAFRALDTLPITRAQIGSLVMAPQDAVKAFTDIIGSLLAVGFEAADIAADPSVSRALVALVNFAQGKEYAGQERATAGAAFSRGQFHAADQRRLGQLIEAQEHAFRVFAEFSDPAHLAGFRALVAGPDSIEVTRLREIALGREYVDEPPGMTADTWFNHTTRRIDAMKAVEEQMSADLAHLCAVKLVESRASSDGAAIDHADDRAASARVAMLVTDVDPAANNLGLDGGVGLYTLDRALPKPMRSILDVMQAQSRRIDDVSQQLESARIALTERKVIERAKGLLMKSRRLSEKEAYALMRQTAMNQNKRIVEVAEAIVSVEGILQA